VDVYADEINKDLRSRWLALVAPTYALVEHKDTDTLRVSVRVLGIVRDAMTDELLVRLLNDGPTAQRMLNHPGLWARSTRRSGWTCFIRAPQYAMQCHAMPIPRLIARQLERTALHFG